MRIFGLFLTILISFLTVPNAQASDSQFFSGIKGQWSGPGEIVAGKYKGTKFVCTFGGNNPAAKTGMDIDGSCRVGVFAQPMNAHILKTAGKYVGSFLDGARGDGMDVTGGRYTNGRLVVDIKRHNLNGIMIVNLNNPNKMNVTVSVKHQDKLIPVIGMNLSRTTDNMLTGSTSPKN